MSGGTAAPGPIPPDRTGAFRYEELRPHADRILGAAEGRGLALRLMGGVAIRERAPDLGGLDGNARRYADIDLVGRLKEVRAADELLRGLGYAPDRAVNTQFGTVRRIYHHPEGFHVDLVFERLEFCHPIDLRGRLELVPRTLAPADLALQKLQIVERNEKDVTDLFLLLLNHELRDRDPSAIEVDRIVRLTADDWGLYTTATDFLDDAMVLLGHAPMREDARARVAERLGQLRGRMEAAPKSARWKLRARVGRRVRWYRVVEEVT